MFLVTLYKGATILERDTCEVGNLLPKVAELMQKHLGDGWSYQENYAVTWRRVKE